MNIIASTASRRPIAGGRRPLAGLTVLALVASACATTTPLRLGRAADARQDYDQAVVEYTKALREDPGNPEARVGLERARLRAAEHHALRGRRFAAGGRLEEAVVELQLAAELTPANADLDRELRTARGQLKTKVAVPREGKTALESLVQRTREMGPSGLDLPRGIKLPESLVFREASSRDVFTALARFAGVNIVFDTSFREAPLTVDLQGATFDQALESVATSTRTFWRMAAAKTVVVIPDTPAKRREYEEEEVRTFYLSNADVKETIDLLRVVVDLRRIAPISGTNGVTVKDTPERVQAASRIIAAIDKARPEVVVDVELMEVDRTRLQEYGVQIASAGASGISGSVSTGDETLTLRDLRSLTQSGVYLAGLPALFYRLLRTDSATRTLANPQLRSLEGVAAQAKFGEEVPVPMTTFSPIATGGVAQQPITSYNYRNIGVNIDITPRTHHDDSVSLAIKLEVSSISGTGYAGLPTFGNRSMTTVIRLRDGETSILGGLIRDDERRVLEGVPGLSDLPLVGRLFARTKTERQQTDIVLTLTPHLVRVLDLDEQDLRPFRVGRDTGPAIIEAPAPEAPPRDPVKSPTQPSAITIVKSPAGGTR